MPHWKNALMDTVYYDGTAADEQDPCEVRIDGDEIVVSYEDDGPVVYRGRMNGPGHFELTCPAENGRGTLHMFPEAKILEGFWMVEGTKGFWRITLKG